MAKNKTSRSINDGKPWRCRCGTLNNPTKHRFFNLPAFQCSYCERKLSLGFQFCLGEIEVGGKSLTGEVRDQKKTQHVRCLYCEAEGARVVHPASMKFHGGGEEFEKVVRGEHSMSNSWLICKNNFAVQRMWGVEEDFMYVDVDETN